MMRILLGFLLAAAPVWACAQVITKPDWKRRPNQEEAAQVMPSEAARRGKNGQAVISCKVNVDGGLYECVVVFETPADLGFGAAALALAPLFQMKPMTVDGKPVAGGSVRIPINWKYNGNPRPSGGARVLQNIGWQAAPSFEEVLASYPRSAREKGLAGRAILLCRYKKAGLIYGCDVRSSTSPVFGDAARSLARYFRGPPVGESLKHEDLMVQLSVSYTSESLRGERRLGKPQWLILPSAEDFAGLYPAEARVAGLAGRVVTKCVIGEGGMVRDCQVETETPPGHGFGEAAMKLASKARMVIWTDEGLPTVGGEVKIPIGFKLDTAAAAANP